MDPLPSTPSSASHQSPLSSSSVDPILAAALNDAKTRALLLDVESACASLLTTSTTDDPTPTSVQFDDLSESQRRLVARFAHAWNLTVLDATTAPEAVSSDSVILVRAADTVAPSWRLSGFANDQLWHTDAALKSMRIMQRTSVTPTRASNGSESIGISEIGSSGEHQQQRSRQLSQPHPQQPQSAMLQSATAAQYTTAPLHSIPSSDDALTDADLALVRAREVEYERIRAQIFGSDDSMAENDAALFDAMNQTDIGAAVMRSIEPAQQSPLPTSAQQSRSPSPSTSSSGSNDNQSRNKSLALLARLDQPRGAESISANDAHLYNRRGYVNKAGYAQPLTSANPMAYVGNPYAPVYYGSHVPMMTVPVPVPVPVPIAMTMPHYNQYHSHHSTHSAAYRPPLVSAPPPPPPSHSQSSSATSTSTTQPRKSHLTQSQIEAGFVDMTGVPNPYAHRSPGHNYNNNNNHHPQVYAHPQPYMSAHNHYSGAYAAQPQPHYYSQPSRGRGYNSPGHRPSASMHHPRTQQPYGSQPRYSPSAQLSSAAQSQSQSGSPHLNHSKSMPFPVAPAHTRSVSVTSPAISSTTQAVSSASPTTGSATPSSNPATSTSISARSPSQSQQQPLTIQSPPPVTSPLLRPSSASPTNDTIIPSRRYSGVGGVSISLSNLSLSSAIAPTSPPFSSSNDPILQSPQSSHSKSPQHQASSSPIVAPNSGLASSPVNGRPFTLFSLNNTTTNTNSSSGSVGKTQSSPRSLSAVPPIIGDSSALDAIFRSTSKPSLSASTDAGIENGSGVSPSGWPTLAPQPVASGSVTQPLSFASILRGSIAKAPPANTIPQPQSQPTSTAAQAPFPQARPVPVATDSTTELNVNASGGASAETQLSQHAPITPPSINASVVAVVPSRSATAAWTAPAAVVAKPATAVGIPSSNTTSTTSATPSAATAWSSIVQRR